MPQHGDASVLALLAGRAVTGDAAAQPSGPQGGSLGALLRAHRLRAQLTQEQLAVRAAVGVRTLRDLEGDRVRRPHRESLRLLADALGLSAVQRAQLALTVGLAADVPRGASPPGERAGPAHPYLLPPGIADFCGRADALRDTVGVLSQGARDPRAGIAVTLVITGSAGMGKTTLAVQAAHQVRARYPDGQLYANLRSADTHPLGPGQVLDVFLRALGVSGAEVPDSLEQRAALYRSRLAERAVLVVLDNVTDESQVRPLLPAAGCALLVTSRSRLSGLDGAGTTMLDGMSEDEAVELLGRAASRVLAGQRDAAERIVRSCGRVPLAVRIAGARLAARPHWSVARLAVLLEDELRRFDELAVGDLDMRASLNLSYRALDPEQRRCLRMLALLEAPDFAPWAAAALLAVDQSAAERVVEALVDAQLLQVVPAQPPRYRFHDLLKVFAREHALAEEDIQDRRAALARALGGWLVLAEHADRALPSRSFVIGRGGAERWHGEPAGDLDAAADADALGWFESERHALVAGVAQAQALGLDDLTWELTNAAAGFFLLRDLRDDWRAALEAARSATARAGNLRGQAMAALGLAELNVELDRLADVAAPLERATLLFAEAGDRRGWAYARYVMAYLHRHNGHLAAALECSGSALATFRQVGDGPGAARATYGLGVAHRHAGHADEALRYLESALELSRAGGDRRFEGQVLRSLGLLHQSSGALDEAEAHLDSALQALEELGEERGIAHMLTSLGQLALERGDSDGAQEKLERALAEFRRLGHPLGEAAALQALGDLHLQRERFAAAGTALEGSLAIWRTLDVPTGIAKSLRSLEDLDAARGERALPEAGVS